MKSFDEIMDSLGAGEIKSKAFEKKDELTKEFKNLMGNFKNLDFNFADNPMLEAVKDNVSAAIERVQDMEVVEFAKGKVNDTKNQFFSLLDIPSQVEVDNLTRKIVSLEKKLKAISKHKPRTRR